MIFHDYTLQADGEIRSHRQTDTDQIVPAAVQVFRDLLRGMDLFRGPVHPHFPAIRLRWDLAPYGALATFSAHGDMLTTSALAHDASSPVFAELAKILATTSVTMPETHFECPAIVSLVWPVEDRDNMMLVADMETCLAAAYFTAR
jgi:hypothetical protein